MRIRRYHWLITGLLLLYYIAAVWMAFRLPALATPNELLNFEYIQVMRQIRGLPNRGLVDSEIRYTEWHQPPVYFTLAAVFGLPLPVPPSDVNPPPPIETTENPHYLSTPRGNLNPVVHMTPQTTPLLFTSRVSAALLGLVGIAALYRAGRQIYPPWVGLLMAGLLAFQPTYIHLSGSVNNDMPLTAVVAIVMSYSILLLNRMERGEEPPPARAFFFLGLLGAAAILTKANGVFVLAFLAVVLLGHLLTVRRWTATAWAAAATMAGLVPLWAGWLWLNAVRMRDALGLSGSLPVGRVLTLSPLDFSHVIPFLPAIWRSYWLDWSAGDVGYGPDWLYAFWLAAVVFMLLGWTRRDPDRRQLEPGIPRRPRPTSLIPILVLAGFMGISYLYFAVKALTVKEAGWMVPEARWWLPGLPALAWLAAAGFSRWWRVPRRQEIACLLAATVPIFIAYGLLLVHLATLYPRAEKLDLSSSPPAELSFDETLALLSADIDPVTSGRPAILSITWQALRDIDVDYTINSQLIIRDPAGWRKIAEHNSFPGQGLNPTGGWRSGEVYRDDLTLVPQGEFDGPTIAAVLIGAQPAGGRVEPVPIAETVIRPAEQPSIPDPLTDPVTYGDGIRLVGAQTSGSDGPLHVTLFWEALDSPVESYAVFVHLVDENGRLIAQADGPPMRGLSPTTIWQRGDIIRDLHTFQPGIVTPPGSRIRVGLYRPESGERQPAMQAGQPLPEEAYELP